MWFNDQAEEAVNFYISIFKNSNIKSTSRYDKAGAKASGRPERSVMTVSFEIAGQEFTALNGGPLFNFSEAVSFVINCATQSEVDHLWESLSEGGIIQQCGWLKDKYGLSWQIVPIVVPQMLQDKDPSRVRRVMETILQMKKLDIKKLQEAYDG